MNKYMKINKQRISKALLTIHNDDNGFFSSGKFESLRVDVLTNIKNNEKLKEIGRYLNYIHDDIWIIDTIALRVKWQKELLSRGDIDEVLWRQFTACDVDFFHVQFRSIFDFLAHLIGLIAEKPEQVRNTSFNKLYKWVIKSEGNKQRIGTDLYEFVYSCEWFENIKYYRDLIVHEGGYTFVLQKNDRIILQIYKNATNKIYINEIMYNENLVDFELYAGLLNVYLIAYLEEFAELANKRLKLKKIVSNAKSYHRGLRVIKNWIERLESLEMDKETPL